MGVRRSDSARRRLGTGLVAAGMVLAVLSPAYAEMATAPGAALGAEQGSERIETYRSERPVGPGVELATVDLYGPDGFTGEPTWLQAHTLSVDLTAGVEIGRIFPGRVAAREPLTEMAAREGAIAAVNADFFDIGGSGAPWGIGIQDGELLQSPQPYTRAPSNEHAVMFSEDQVGAIGEIVFEGTVLLPGGQTARLDALNKAELLENQIGMFTSVWGTYCRCRPTENTDDDVEVVVTSGIVTDIADTPRAGAIADDSFVFVGREGGADVLRSLKVGDEVAVDYNVRAPGDMRVRSAMSGRQLLVVDGKPERLPDANNTPEPRTAVGFSEDGTQMWLVSVDGRQPEFSRGIGLGELAEMMVDLGAHTALNLDGGGSTTIVAREPGQDKPRLINRPSDGQVRPVPTGLAMFAPEGSGTLAGYWVRTALDPNRTEGSAFRPPVRTERVFPGLTRRLVADGHDETYGPAEGRTAAARHWRSNDARIGVVDSDGVFTARSSGDVTVTVRSGRAAGGIGLTVLDELERLEAIPAAVGITHPGGTATFEVTGYDANGYTAPIEPAEIVMEYDESAVGVVPDDQGRFEITALADHGEETVTVRVGDVTTTLAVGLGMQDVMVDSFDDTSNWGFWALRATGSISTTDVGYIGPGLRLDFDFTQTDLIRGAGIWPADNLLPVAGEPTAFNLWVHSEGWRLRTRLEVVDRAGRLTTIEPGFITEPGWQQVTYEVPSGVAYPLSLRRIFVNELDPATSYHGTLVFDELTAVVPREPVAKRAEPVVDPVVVRGEPEAPADWRFAVLSDVGISADDPDGPAALRARRALTEVKERGVATLIINGGFVASGTAPNLAFARQLIEDELGSGTAYHYVPGEAERHAGSLAAFTAEFGQVPRVLDHAGVRFLLLNSSYGSYRTSDWTQLGLLRKELAAAAGDPAVDTVVVVQDLPLRDPSPPPLAQLTDRKEAATVEQWLTGFREESGKGAVLIAARAAMFGAARVDGVPYVTNGATGNPTVGGFAGWSLWSVGGADDGLRVAFLPRADAVELDAPVSVDVGASAAVGAVVLQDGRRVPVRYPMPVTWSGSHQLFIGAPEDAASQHVAAFDPATGELTALATGTVTLRATVNTESAEAEIPMIIEDAAADSRPDPR